MQCMAAARACATTQPPVAAALSVTPLGLLAAFASVPDPRRRQGRRFPLAAVLAVAVLAILANHLSVLAIAEWGADQSSETLRALGFRTGRTPHQSTLQRLFAKLEPSAVARALQAYFVSRVPAPRTRGAQGVAIDGKAQRGRLAGNPPTGATVHALTAFCHDHGVVLAQVPITSTADKTEAELTVAPTLLAQIDWRGRVFTGDALHCQRALCRQVLDAGGDYLLLVKENQPTLYHDLACLFDPPPAKTRPIPLADRREVHRTDKGHGRREGRHLIASTDLTDYSDWPGLAQVFRLERTWHERARTKGEVQYGITSLPPAIASASRLLALKRGHWAIENSLHHVKDVTLGEDRSRIRTGTGPDVVAMLRNTAVSLLHHAGYSAIAQRLRYFSRHPTEVLGLLHLPTENA